VIVDRSKRAQGFYELTSPDGEDWPAALKPWDAARLMALPTEAEVVAAFAQYGVEVTFVGDGEDGQ